MTSDTSVRPLIAILRGVEPEEVLEVTGAIVEAGITMIEVPTNSPRPFESIARLAAAYSGDAKIGGGTITDANHVAKLAEAGGTFAVSPDCNPEVIAATRARGMESYPGVCSPTDAFIALHSGATALKLFPAFVAGSEGLKAMISVLPENTSIFAVGGVGPTQFPEWISAGATGFGIGSSLYKPGDNARRVGEAARNIVAAFDAAIQQIR